MKRLMIGVLALGAMVSAQASSGPMEGASFEVLKDILLQGVQKPKLDKVKDIAWSGRCFYDHNPKVAVNAGFYIKKQNGFYEAFGYQEPRGKEDFFDNMNLKDVAEWNPRLTSAEVDKSFFAVDKANGFSSFEQSGEYLIEEQITFVKVPGRLVNRWVTTGHCYYFKTKN